MKILITNIPNPCNMGSLATIAGLQKLIKDSVPGANVEYLATYDVGSNKKFYDRYNIVLTNNILYQKNKHISNFIIRYSKFLVATIFQRFKLPIKSPYKNRCIIINPSTDSLNDLYGIGMPIYTLLIILADILSGNKTALIGVSVGPFRNRFLKKITRLILNRVDLITLREDISRKYLEELKVNMPKVCVTADSGFILESVDNDNVNQILDKENITLKNNSLIIGISPSQFIHKYAFNLSQNDTGRYNEFLRLMICVIQHLLVKYDANILLIPHVILDTDDDRIISNKICENFVNDNRVKLIKGEYTASELKGIIGLCDIFVGCRMHATIASTSLGVPTIAITYGSKFHGVIGKMMGQDKMIVNIESSNFDDLSNIVTSKIDYVIQNREYIHEDLMIKAKLIKERVMTNSIYIKELLKIDI